MRPSAPLALLALLHAAVVLGACAVTPPPVAVETTAGLVRGESESAAREVAMHLEDLEPRVREILIDTRDHRPEVWVQRVLRRNRYEESPATISGFTRFVDRVPLRIYLRESDDARWALAHELVHALTGPTWDALPGVLSEGLADVVAGRLSPDLVPQARAVRLLHASLYFGGLSLRLAYFAPPDRAYAESRVWYSYTGEEAAGDPRDVLELDRWELNEELSYLPESYYGIGYLVAERVVERVGIEGLYAMCAAALASGAGVVPAAELLEIAELEHATAWNGAIRACLGEAEVHEVNRMLPHLFPDLLVEFYRELEVDPSVDPEQLLQATEPSLLLEDGTALPLTSLAGLRSELVARWNAVDATR